ncbi:helix-turn-helix domain-containing protein [uncultured Dubosiella sp.]|uniref:helix-turn-helix domain-containing protein n=1 Tax=uncultured Dubosiella sp. TaxID=1937011 RepID=UPI00208ADE57|nr:helix-turn-helix transcriptional regulator [uncultured Dubosiella sp.]GJM58432.1 hypothetical protein EROP_21250 [Erysipelotrichaceae bacterium OPF54]
MSSYQAYKKNVLKDPEIKAEYEALEPEFDIIQALIDARLQQHLTQKELSGRTGITQADISRIENGTRNPSLNMIKKLAKALNMQLKLEFIPVSAKNKN